MTDIKHVKIKAGGANKPYVALFRRDNNELHLILNEDINCDEDSVMSFDGDRYELVRAKTLQEMLVGGKKFTDKQRLKETARDIWDESWEDL